MIFRQLSVRSAALLMTALLLPVAYATAFQGSIAEAEGAEPTGAVNASVKTVLISHFKYQPETLTVNVRDTVEWKNTDIVPHTATAVDRKVFDSGRIAKGGSWRFTAMKKGTYNYFCTLHPNMKGKLIVQ